MNDDSDQHDLIKDRVSRLFQFVRALHQLRNPVQRQIRELPWTLSVADLPKDASVSLEIPAETTSAPSSDEVIASDFIFRVERPTLPPVPPPPPEIVDWIIGPWQRYDGQISHDETRAKAATNDQSLIERFEDDAMRVEAFAAWSTARDIFVATNMPALEAFRLFERVYELHGMLERDAERYEILLGDGVLCWNVPTGSIRFPIILQRLEMEFEPSIPRFTFRDATSATEFNSALFRAEPTVDGAVVAAVKKEMDEGDYHPLTGPALTAFLKSIPPRLAVHGEYLDEPPSVDTREPTLYRSPLIFLRKRTFGFAEALDRIVEDIETRDSLPQSLLNIVGLGSIAPTLDGAVDSADEGGVKYSDVLFTKSANEEQYRIAETLERHACVLVQGPPGTGKTHTIANLLGHLLAEGKSVLVTSSTTKALRVLREKVVPKLQPLCVSVLESDAKSNDQLKNSIDSIVDRISTTNESSLSREAARYAERRETLLTELAMAKNRLIHARHSDTEPLTIGNETYSVIEAAKILARRINDDGWIPRPVLCKSSLTLTPDEVRTLYRTNRTVPKALEAELAANLPDPDTIIRPHAFSAIIEEMVAIGSDEMTFEEYWRALDGAALRANALPELMAFLPELLEIWSEDTTWLYAVAYDGFRGGGHSEAWISLFAQVEALAKRTADAQDTLARCGPCLAADLPVEDQHSLLQEVVRHLRSGGNLGFFSLLSKPKWKTLFPKLKVNGRPPRSIDDFDALSVVAGIEVERASLRSRWERQVVAIGGAPISENKPEEFASQIVRSIRSALLWHNSQLKPFKTALVEQGFAWDKAASNALIAAEEQADFRAQVRLCRNVVPGALETRRKQLTMRAHFGTLAEIEHRLQSFSGQTSERLLNAVKVRSVDGYELAYGTLKDLYATIEELKQRRALLSRLAQVAPAWAEAISSRVSPHDEGEAPGDSRSAWLWAQIAEQLEVREKEQVGPLEAEVQKKTESLQKITADLADAKAWLAQRRRTGLEQQQALTGWQQTIKKIGKGTGKRVPHLRKHARKLMDEAKSAVPVWIMPLIRVAENYDPRNTKFDVVIVDEASQSDVTGLLALYYGHQIVVVGDDEQVSPEAVGQRVDETQHLIDEFLYGVPNAQLYDGRSSIYDLAKQAFGGTICLREHFRCVPDIIQFSNYLSYDDKLVALREASESLLLPHVVSHRVTGTVDSKTNNEEAEEILALIMSCMEQPEYDGKKFGVISLVGEDQAAKIETMLRKHVDPYELERRRLLCGKSAHFQGDERDVVFLSIVDSAGQTLLRKRDDPIFKKRFNVAASRARDQMWVVHSLDVSDLQTGDLRRRLIEHALNPKAIEQRIDAATARAESDFERDVLRRLVAAGYKVRPQYRVGPYRIDIIVEGRTRRLAVECDGDQYHTILELQADLERQNLLERVGLVFHRIRGSKYYRDPEAEFQSLILRLDEMGIEPIATSTEDVPTDSELLIRVRARAAEIRRELSGEREFEYYSGQGSSTATQDASAETPSANGHPRAASAYVPPGEDDLRSGAPVEFAKDGDANDAGTVLTVGSVVVRDDRAGPAYSSALFGNTETLILRLLGAGFSRDQIIDRREHERGALWVVVGQSQADFFDDLAREGVRFYFSAQGGKATKHQPAWWTRCTD